MSATGAPSVVIHSFSGEVEGKVTMVPVRPSCSRSRARSAVLRRAGRRRSASTAGSSPLKEASESSLRSSHSPPIGQVAHFGSPATGSVYPQGSEFVVHGSSRAPVQAPGGLPAGLPEHRDVASERLGGPGDVRDACGPVVHLQVDVHRVVRVPRREHLLVPYALQVRGWQPAWDEAARHSGVL